MEGAPVGQQFHLDLLPDERVLLHAHFEECRPERPDGYQTEIDMLMRAQKAQLEMAR